MPIGRRTLRALSVPLPGHIADELKHWLAWCPSDAFIVLFSSLLIVFPLEYAAANEPPSVSVRAIGHRAGRVIAIGRRGLLVP
jgi:hypothetical protein